MINYDLIRDALEEVLATGVIDLSKYVCIESFRPEILMGDNDYYETYEVFLAVLYHLNNDSLEEEQYELMELIRQVYISQELAYRFVVSTQKNNEIKLWFKITNEFYNDEVNKLINDTRE